MPPGYFADVDLVRQPGVPELTVEPASSHELSVSLRAPADRYVYFAHLTSPSGSTHFSDNYFDLEAGESRIIIITNRSITLTPEMVSITWR